MKTRKFKAGETYRTRNGAIARVYAADDTLGGLIHGATNTDIDGWDATQWENDGKFFSDKSESPWDLMPETEHWYCVAYVISTGKPVMTAFRTEKERDEFVSTLVCKFKTFELEKR